jgi:transcriptional regulator with XRE-family HTH domain
MNEGWLLVSRRDAGAAEEEGRAYGATVAKRRLSRRLAAMRVRAGFSANEVGDKLNWSRGRLQRMEGNQWRLPEPSYIRDLARIYGASDADEAELLDLTMHARARQWWRAYEDVFGKDDEFPGFENDAARIGTYMPLVLPGLLQTRPYTEAHMRAGSKPPDWRTRALEARLRRQQVLDRPRAAPWLTAVIHRGIPRLPLGDPGRAPRPVGPPDRREPPPQCGASPAALRGRPAPGHEQPD